MVCSFCDESSAIALLDKDSADFHELLQNMWKQHLSLKATFLEKYRVKCQENASLENENQILRAANTYQKDKDFIDFTLDKTPEKVFNGISSTQDILGDGEWDITFRTASDKLRDKENSSLATFQRKRSKEDFQHKTNGFSSPENDLFEDDNMFRKSVRPKTTSTGWRSKKDSPEETNNSKRSSFEKNVAIPLRRLNENFRIATVSPISQDKKQKLRQTTLNFNRVSTDETFCEDLLNATPENHKTSSRILDRMSRIAANQRLATPPPDTIVIPDSQDNPQNVPGKKQITPSGPPVLRDFVTPTGFWDLGFPPTAKTQPPSPNDMLAKRPKKKL